MENKPQLILIAGPNGAGKSTLSERLIFRKINIINPDVIAKESFVSIIKAGKIAIEQRKEALANKKSFAIETTLAGSGEIELMKDAKALGYKVNLVYVGIGSVSISNRRVKERVSKGGHDVPSKDILRRYERSVNNISKAFEIADRAYILDNTKKPMSLLYIKNERIEKQTKHILPKWAEKSIQDLKAIKRFKDRSRDDFGL
ncbi:MAG: zeta toxin family protein [Helicobacteraceae bacterium]|nr:zeta toxin family protein [Helicobacteraceae bacterium]